MMNSVPRGPTKDSTFYAERWWLSIARENPRPRRKSVIALRLTTGSNRDLYAAKDMPTS